MSRAVAVVDLSRTTTVVDLSRTHRITDLSPIETGLSENERTAET